MSARLHILNCIFPPQFSTAQYSIAILFTFHGLILLLDLRFLCLAATTQKMQMCDCLQTSNEWIYFDIFFLGMSITHAYKNCKEPRVQLVNLLHHKIQSTITYRLFCNTFHYS
jgi:hypothetical protein